MHRTLKAEATRPAPDNLLRQQERFDDFVEEFDTQRPHEALDMKRPADVHVPPTKKHPAFLPDPDYSTYDDMPRVGTQRLIPGLHPHAAMCDRQKKVCSWRVLAVLAVLASWRF